jgi:hypothetical protein
MAMIRNNTTGFKTAFPIRNHQNLPLHARQKKGLTYYSWQSTPRQKKTINY